MSSLTTFLLIMMFIFTVNTSVTASTCHSNYIVMATTADTVNTFSIASAGHHSLDGFSHYSTPAGGANNNNDSTPLLAAPLGLMITTLPTMSCHDICLHHHRFLVPSEEPTSIRSASVASCNGCSNIRDDPCTCSDEGRCLLLDNCCLLLPHMFPFKLQRDPKTISEWPSYLEPPRNYFVSNFCVIFFQMTLKFIISDLFFSVSYYFYSVIQICYYAHFFQIIIFILTRTFILCVIMISFLNTLFFRQFLMC